MAVVPRQRLLVGRAEGVSGGRPRWRPASQRPPRFGVVYEAVHAGLDKRVALKVLPHGLAADRLEQFLREARTVAGLHHTNVVSVFDGTPLDAFLNPTRESGHPARPAEGTTHTPMTAGPSTGTSSRRTCCSTWPASCGWPTSGLAFRADDPTLTTEGAILGTPRYMSPEQARAEKTDARTDVYALGVTLYELLTGTAAFASDGPMNVIHRVLTHTPPRPRSLNRRVPRDLETVVLKAIAKRPGVGRRHEAVPVGRVGPGDGGPERAAEVVRVGGPQQRQQRPRAGRREPQAEGRQKAVTDRRCVDLRGRIGRAVWNFPPTDVHWRVSRRSSSRSVSRSTRPTGGRRAGRRGRGPAEPRVPRAEICRRSEGRGAGSAGLMPSGSPRRAAGVRSHPPDPRRSARATAPPRR